MTINDLRVLIADLPGDMPVLVPAGDHEYAAAAAGIAAVWDKGPKNHHNLRYDEYSIEGETNAQAFVVSR